MLVPRRALCSFGGRSGKGVCVKGGALPRSCNTEVAEALEIHREWEVFGCLSGKGKADLMHRSKCKGLEVGITRNRRKRSAHLPARRLGKVPDAVKKQKEEVVVPFMGSDWTCAAEVKGGGM